MHRRSLLAASLAASPWAAASAQTGWPDRPIAITVGFLAGGSVDIAARILAERLPAHLPPGPAGRARIIVENRPGAGGSVAGEWARRQTPDGHSLLMASASSHGTNPAALPATTPYDPIADFTPIARIGAGPLVLVVPRISPHRSVADLLAAMRANPGAASWATSGAGGIGHLTGELMLLRSGGLRAEHVPYRGGAAVTEALAKGEVAFSFEVLASTIGHLRDGLSRGLAVTTLQRHAMFPDIPTLHESGFPGFDVSTWNVLLGPRGMTAGLTATINRAVLASLADPDVRNRLSGAGVDPAEPATPMETSAFLVRELAMFSDIVTRAGLRLQR